MNTFKILCSDAKICHAVKELVFLGKVVFEESVNFSGAVEEGDYMAESEEAVAAGWVKLPDSYVVTSDSLSNSHKLYQKCVAEYLGDEDNLAEVLSECLPKLVKLRTVTLRSQIDGPGLNTDAFFFTDPYAMKMASQQCQATGIYHGNLRLAYRKANDVVAWQGVDVLFQALAHTSSNITELKIGNGISDQLEYHLGNYANCDPSTLSCVAANLTHLTVSCKDDDEKEDHDAWREFVKAAKHIQSVTVYLHSNGGDFLWHTAQEHGTVLGAILCHGDWKNLHRLEVIGKREQPSCVRAVWLDGFLRRHAKTLEELTLSACLLVNWYDAKNKSPTTMKWALQNMRDQLNLSQARIEVYRRDEHKGRACWGQDPTGAECYGTCTKYMLVKAPGERWADWLEREKLEAMATQLGVDLKDGVWDFGEFVMRK